MITSDKRKIVHNKDVICSENKKRKLSHLQSSKLSKLLAESNTPRSLNLKDFYGVAKSATNQNCSYTSKDANYKKNISVPSSNNKQIVKRKNNEKDWFEKLFENIPKSKLSSNSDIAANREIELGLNAEHNDDNKETKFNEDFVSKIPLETDKKIYNVEANKDWFEQLLEDVKRNANNSCKSSVDIKSKNQETGENFKQCPKNSSNKKTNLTESSKYEAFLKAELSANEHCINDNNEEIDSSDLSKRATFIPELHHNTSSSSRILYNNKIESLHDGKISSSNTRNFGEVSGNTVVKQSSIKNIESVRDIIDMLKKSSSAHPVSDVVLKESREKLPQRPNNSNKENINTLVEMSIDERELTTNNVDHRLINKQMLGSKLSSNVDNFKILDNRKETNTSEGNENWLVKLLGDIKQNVNHNREIESSDLTEMLTQVHETKTPCDRKTNNQHVSEISENIDKQSGIETMKSAINVGDVISKETGKYFIEYSNNTFDKNKNIKLDPVCNSELVADKPDIDSNENKKLVGDQILLEVDKKVNKKDTEDNEDWFKNLLEDIKHNTRDKLWNLDVDNTPKNESMSEQPKNVINKGINSSNVNKITYDKDTNRKYNNTSNDCETVSSDFQNFTGISENIDKKMNIREVTSVKDIIDMLKISTSSRVVRDVMTRNEKHLQYPNNYLNEDSNTLKTNSKFNAIYKCETYPSNRTSGDNNNCKSVIPDAPKVCRTSMNIIHEQSDIKNVTSVKNIIEKNTSTVNSKFIAKSTSTNAVTITKNTNKSYNNLIHTPSEENENNSTNSMKKAAKYISEEQQCFTKESLQADYMSTPQVNYHRDCRFDKNVTEKITLPNQVDLKFNYTTHHLRIKELNAVICNDLNTYDPNEQFLGAKEGKIKQEVILQSIRNEDIKKLENKKQYPDFRFQAGVSNHLTSNNDATTSNALIQEDKNSDDPNHQSLETKIEFGSCIERVFQQPIRYNIPVSRDETLYSDPKSPDISKLPKKAYLKSNAPCRSTQSTVHNLVIYDDSSLHSTKLQSSEPKRRSTGISNENTNADCQTAGSFGQPSELLQDQLLASALKRNYDICIHKKENKTPVEETNIYQSLLNSVTQPLEVNKDNIDQCSVKRFKKGKMKIYRLKKLKKRSSHAKEVQGEEQKLNFEDILQELTQDFLRPQNEINRLDSLSSISTSSSYESVNTNNCDNLSTGSKDLPLPKQRLRRGFNQISRDASLLYCRTEFDELTDVDKDEIINRIQDIMFKVYENLRDGRKVSLTYMKRCFENCQFKDERLQLKPREESIMSEIYSNVQRSQRKFKLILLIMDKILALLGNGTKLTKREVYYQFKDMATNQGVTDRAIQTISCFLNVGIWALNIVAQSGLVFGNLNILLTSGETINCNVPGTSIPIDISEIIEVQSPAYFILVVEKEAIFHKLIQEDLPNKLTRPFILITGKGFPDLNTQLFLKKLWMVMAIPVFILVDPDPHGINIMLNYRFGSVTNAHVSQHLAVPKAKWLGVYPSEIITYNISNQPLTENESKLVRRLLKTPYMDEAPRIVEELSIMQEKNYKASIEGLIKSEKFLSDVYLPTKFFTHNFI